MITISNQDYLKAIAETEAEGGTVIPSHTLSLAEGVKACRDIRVKCLTKDGGKAAGHIRLTSEARAIAERTIVRHHLVKRMLSEIFGMAWYEVHDEAQGLEHAVSPSFEKKLVEQLGHKDTCPHGNGLALCSPTERRKKGLRLLTEVEPGSK